MVKMVKLEHLAFSSSSGSHQRFRLCSKANGVPRHRSLALALSFFIGFRYPLLPVWREAVCAITVHLPARVV